MRFAYIDSQGKEVGIPSVEALQLRIELGAITEETIFYDASNDRWDPAGEHEIFRSLSREIRERGQGGPRPPTPTATSPAPDRGPDEPTTETARRRATDPFEQEQDPLEETAAPGEVDWVEAELEELADPGEERPAASAESAAADDWDVDLGEFGSFDLAPGLQEEAPVRDSEADEPDADALEDVPDASEPDLELDGEIPFETPLAERFEGADAIADDSALELESPLAEQSDEAFVEDPAEVGMETPDFSGALEVAADEGEWKADQPDPSETEGPAEESGGRRVEDEPIRRRDPYERRPQPPRTAERPRRPRPPQRRRSGPPPAVLAGLVVIVVVAGGWFGWSALRGEGESTVELTETVVALPEIPEELMPTVREVGDSALADLVAGLRQLSSDFGLADEPNEDWLAGVYLANAGRYPDVVAYWGAFRNYADSVRAGDEEAFLSAVRGRLDASEVAGESRDLVYERLRAGFQATEPERREVYDDLEELIYAATGLHEFLLGNQSNISYEPAAGLSRDPVTEAIPSTPALGEEMWERVGRIPAALDQLGTLDRVTTERILDVVYRRVAAVGVR